IDPVAQVDFFRVELLREKEQVVVTLWFFLLIHPRLKNLLRVFDVVLQGLHLPVEVGCHRTLPGTRSTPEVDPAVIHPPFPSLHNHDRRSGPDTALIVYSAPPPPR